MVAPPAPGKVTSLPSMAGSSALTDSGLRGGSSAACEPAGLAAAEPEAAAEAAGFAEAAPDAAAEAAGFAEADAAAEAAGLADAAADAAALAGLGAAELAGAALGVAWPPHPRSDRTDAAEATPPAMYITRRIISRRERWPSL